MIQENLKSLPCQHCCSGSKEGKSTVVPKSFLQVDDSFLAPTKDLALSIVVDDTLEVMMVIWCMPRGGGGVGVLVKNDAHVTGQSFRPRRMKTLLFLQGPLAVPRSSQHGTTSKRKGRKPNGVTAVRPLELSLSGLSTHDWAIEHCNVVCRKKRKLVEEDVAAKLLDIGKAAGLTLREEDGRFCHA
ncbi:hypothetical protein RIF29_25390 [Crotalaria pallida]|uniref:Uncharacterized protein n=1 Tax=Crotalaria pallida TaxID=3830 RepID=A0AAN9EM68_CROPI